MNAIKFLVAAYIATWLIHSFYLGSLVRRYSRARLEMKDLEKGVYLDSLVRRYRGRTKGSGTLAEGKQRHGCLTAWLAIMIIANSLTGLAYLLWGAAIKSNLPKAPAWAIPTLVTACIANVVFSFALLRWKKWGFFGFVGSSIVTLVVNLTIGLSLGSVLLGAVGVALLYGVLQIGYEKKGWTQLE
jgi:hypothetical protein